MALVDRLQPGSCAAVSIVGLAKNCGKTTALNYLASELRQRGTAVGLTSIGRDGEDEDILSRLPKPHIPVEPGDMAVTAEGSLSGTTAAFEVMLRTSFQCALGRLLLVRVERAGQIELAGPATSSQLRETVSLLREHGAQTVLIDGALGRLSSSSPSICGCVVVAAGGVLGDTPAAVAARVRYQAELFLLPQPHHEDLDLICDTARRAGDKAAAITKEREVTVLESSAATTLDLGRIISKPASWLWTGGGLTDKVLSTLSTSGKIAAVVVQDASHILATRPALERWRLAGGRVYVLESIKVAAITTSPWRERLEPLNAEELVCEVSRQTPAVPCYDVVAGLKAAAGTAVNIGRQPWPAQVS